MRLLASSLTPSWNSVCFFLAICLLAWVCRDYPSWRQERRDRSKNAPPPADRKLSHCEPDRQTSAEAAGANDFSILHYILAMPVASIYIVARAVYDAIRFTVFWALWGLEKSAPSVDDWLFHTLTVWLPEKFGQLDHWWTEQGSLLWQDAQNYTTQCIIPMIIRTFERLFVVLTQLAGVLHKFWLDFKCFRQMLVEFGNRRKLIIIDFVEKWIVPVILRLWRLAVILYEGAVRVCRSIWQDIVWIAQVVIPSTIEVIAKTRLFRWLHSVIFAGIEIAHCIVSKLSVPLLRILHLVVLKALIAMNNLLQSHLFQRHWRQIRNAISVRMVWFILEASEHVQSSVRFLQFIFAHVLLPVAILYMRNIHPRLSRAYHLWVSVLVYRVLQPMWIAIHPYVIILYRLIHSRLSVPLAAFSTLVQMIAWQGLELGHRIGLYLGLAVQSVLKSLLPAIQVIYSWVAIWLERQVPAVTHACQIIWDLVASYDWVNLWSQVIQWSTTQGETLFLSLERMLIDWFKDQAPQEEEPVLRKTS
ncbi:hypothetical protein BX666DRAFT_1908894 [Dichotomocladium elegans]|nr:hypothetical protein BX666DRAFT_1908894 [Dichotomocladium elegans]